MVTIDKWQKLDKLLGAILKDISRIDVRELEKYDYIEMRNYYFKFYVILKAYDSYIKKYESVMYKD